MSTASGVRRFTATSNLREVLRFQGRDAAWVGRRIGVSKYQMSHVLAGRRNLKEGDGLAVAELLGIPFNLLFECSDEHEDVSEGIAS